MAAGNKRRELDWSAFPAGMVNEYSTHLCLACIFKIFTAQLGLAPRTAYSEIKRHAPNITELTSTTASRPYFDSDEKSPHCPYCNAARRWHAKLDTYRIEGGKATDVLRRALVKTLPKTDEQFQLVEAKSDRRTLFFEWLDMLDRTLDLDSDTWLNEATKAYLQRREPKSDWLKFLKASASYVARIVWKKVGSATVSGYFSIRLFITMRSSFNIWSAARTNTAVALLRGD